MGIKPVEEFSEVFDMRMKASGERGLLLNRIVSAKKKLGKYRTFTQAAEALILDHADLIDVSDQGEFVPGKATAYGMEIKKQKQNGRK